MNPYTYKRVRREQPGEPAKPAGGGSWAKDIINAPVSSVVAFAFVLFAAGSVMAMTAVATPEVAMDNSDVAVVHRAAQEPQVLGDSTSQPVIDDSALEAVDPTGVINAKAVGFDSALGRWNYKIAYGVLNVSGSATLSIGKYVVASNITATGQIETGAILKPNMVYRVFLWTQDSSGSKQILARTEIKTGKANNSKKEDKRLSCMPPRDSTMASSTPAAFCVKKDDGTTVCTPPVCGFVKPLPAPNLKNSSSSQASSTK